MENPLEVCIEMASCPNPGSDHIQLKKETSETQIDINYNTSSFQNKNLLSGSVKVSVTYNKHETFTESLVKKNSASLKVYVG